MSARVGSEKDRSQVNDEADEMINGARTKPFGATQRARDRSSSRLLLRPLMRRRRRRRRIRYD